MLKEQRIKILLREAFEGLTQASPLQQEAFVNVKSWLVDGEIENFSENSDNQNNLLLSFVNPLKPEQTITITINEGGVIKCIDKVIQTKSDFDNLMAYLIK